MPRPKWKQPKKVKNAHFTVICDYLVHFSYFHIKIHGSIHITTKYPRCKSFGMSMKIENHLKCQGMREEAVWIGRVFWLQLCNGKLFFSCCLLVELNQIGHTPNCEFEITMSKMKPKWKYTLNRIHAIKGFIHHWNGAPWKSWHATLLFISFMWLEITFGHALKLEHSKPARTRSFFSHSRISHIHWRTRSYIYRSHHSQIKCQTKRMKKTNINTNMKLNEMRKKANG